MANRNTDDVPTEKWYIPSKKCDLGKRAFAAATDHATNHHGDDIYIGCSSLDERRCVLFDRTAEEFDKIVGGQFWEEVHNFPDTEEGIEQQDHSRKELKLKMKHGYKFCKKRLSKATTLTITTKRDVAVSGVHYTFQFDPLKDKIYNEVVEHCKLNHDIEEFDGLTKEQMCLKLLDLPDCEFNNIFEGSLDISTDGFFESKLVVKGYVTKLMEAAMAVSTAAAAGAAAPRADEAEALKAQSNASDSKVDDLASLVGNFVRVSTSNHDDITSGMNSLARSVDTVNSTVEKERVERIRKYGA